MRELRADDWLALRELRLHALRSELGLFFKHPDEEAALPEDYWRAWAAGDEGRQVFGLFDGERLVGITGTFTDSDDSTGRTVGFGMSYLSPEYRGRGFASLFYETRFAWVRAAAFPTRNRRTSGLERSVEANDRKVRFPADRKHPLPLAGRHRRR